jgi:hypothetical protein
MSARFGWPRRRGREADAPAPGVELASLLERYAAALTPSDRQRSELRAAVLQAAADRASAGAGDPARARRRTRPWALAGALLAVLLAAGTVAAAQSGPGQPFYHLRLAIESLTLPAQGSARVDALLGQLDTRLAEARAASQHGSEPAVQDAVQAYLDALSQLTASGSSAADVAAVQSQLERHTATLQSILQTAPAPAKTGLQQALDQTVRAQQAVQGHASGPPVPTAHPTPPATPPGTPPASH